MLKHIRAALGAGIAAAGLAVPAIAQEAEVRLFAIIYPPGPGWDETRPMMEQGLRPHGEYLNELFQEGRLLVAGPLFGPEGGLVIVQAGNLAEAEAMMAADPAVQAGIFAGEIQEWRTRFVADAPLPVILQ
jgi:uncharacterized protein